MEGEKRVWMNCTRRWVNNSMPTDDPGCALYLELRPPHAAPLRLIKRSPALQNLALENGGNEEYAKKMAATFHFHRRKARAQYNRSLCEALFTKGSPHCIAYNILSAEGGPPTLAKSTEHLGSTEALRERIVSDSMYADDKLFSLWVGLHASGALYGSKQRGRTENIASYLSVNYDSHCRLEAYQRMSHQVRTADVSEIRNLLPQF